MPYCEPCEQYHAPSAIKADGTCPKCGASIADPGETTAVDESTPWHFKLLVLAVVVYLGWRLVQFIGWIV